MDSHDTYNHLLKHYASLLWAMCRDAANGNCEQTRDLFQEVALRLWQHLGRLHTDAEPHEVQAWVEWQARHVINLAKKRQQMVYVGDLPEIADTDGMAEAERRRWVDELIATLDDKDRQLIQMRMDGYSADEIASTSGLSQDAVYQRMHRIVVQLRNMVMAIVALLVTSAIAVAVVPQWRQAVFHTGSPTETLPEDESPSNLNSPDITDTVATPKIEVNWYYHGVGYEGYSVTWCRTDRTVTYTRFARGRTIQSVMHNAPDILFNDTLKIDSMNISLKRTAFTAAVMALATATQAQVAHDFQSVTSQGDTLFCIITDSAQHHISVRGDESVWNAPYIRYSDTLIIPSTVEHDGEQYTVTALADSAFYNHGEITAAVIPSSVTTIGRLALANTMIVELEVPDGVDSIGPKAFGTIGNVIYHGNAGGSPWAALTVNGFEENGLFYPDSSRNTVTACRPWVTQAVLPASVRSIGRYAFSLRQLESITLPEGLETIGNSAFQSCSRLGSVVIPSTVTKIDNYAFFNSFRTDGEATVTIADAECSIGQGAFYYSNMSAIDLGNRVTSIGSDAFASLGRVDSIIVPNSCTYLAPRAFCYNYNGHLKKVHLPDNLDTIRDELLHGCTGLEEVNIPSSVVYIGEMALSELFSVTELTLPAGLTYIGPWALGSCSNISEMTSLAAVPPQVCDDAFEGMNPNIILTVPCGTIESYRTTPIWNYFQNVFDDCETVPEVELPDVSIRVSQGRIVVEGADGEVVTVYDMEGRQVASTICQAQCSLWVTNSGLFLVKIGNRPAVKVILPYR